MHFYAQGFYSCWEGIEEQSMGFELGDGGCLSPNKEQNGYPEIHSLWVII